MHQTTVLVLHYYWNRLP